MALDTRGSKKYFQNTGPKPQLTKCREYMELKLLFGPTISP